MTTSTTVAIIDYGMGNLHSVAKALEHADTHAKVIVTADKQQIANADRVLLPGVGSIRDCVGEMQRLDLIDTIKQAAAAKPFLGICIGMQALMTHSDENDGVDCLNIIPGNVERFADKLSDPFSAANTDGHLKIPHMGWNQVNQQIKHPLWQDIPQNQRFYFVHSYYVDPVDETLIAGTTDYGIEFVSVIARDNVFAAQFHPEKSAHDGLQLLKNFCRWQGRL